MAIKNSSSDISNVGSLDNGERWNESLSAPYVPANFVHWSRAAYWDPVEAACLSLELEPGFIKMATDEELELKVDVLFELGLRLQLTTRIVQTGILGQKSSPTRWLCWFHAAKIPVPQSLKDLFPDIFNANTQDQRATAEETSPNKVEKFGEGKAAARRGSSTDSATTKEIISLEKLVVAMARGGYGYSPHDRKSGVAREIAEDALKVGITISDDTVRKYLKRAAENHLPGDTL